jgi:transcription initiation factor TFIID/TFIIF subunit
MVLQIDMDKLAENLQKLGEDDLLQVVQMVHDNKTAETYTKNDVDRMYFFPHYYRHQKTDLTRRG